MPRVLLLGAADETIDALKDLSFEVFTGAHTDGVTRGVVPSPTEWDLILHLRCGERTKAQQERDIPEVNDVYLAEAQCPEVTFSWGKRCRGIHRVAVTGYKAFEALPVDENFEAVVDLFEEQSQNLSTQLYLETRFVSKPGGISSTSPERILAANQYGKTVAAMWEADGHELLALIPPVSEASSEASVVRHLLTRTLPKIFPRAYWDEFVPERVRQLEADRGRVIAERLAQVREIEAQIREELDFFADFSALPRLRDDAFKSALAKALQFLGYEVTDLDLDEEKESKDSDLMAEAEGIKGYVEAKSSGNRNCNVRHIEDFDRNLEKARARYGQEDFRLLVFNGQVDVPNAERGATFSSDVQDEANDRGIGLTTGRDVLAAIEKVRSRRLSPEEVRANFATVGLIALV